MSGELASNAGYAEEAADLLVRYEAIPFEQAFDGMLHLFPTKPSRLIDIGGGTGRVAATLVARGHEVLAVEPTTALRDGGATLHPDPAIRWLDDSLPKLARVDECAFDLALLVAVWMHLTVEERRAGMTRLAELIAPNGRAILTLRHGPIPVGRRMFDVGVEDTIDLAESAGLATIFRDEVASRGAANIAAGVRWTRLSFQRH